MLPHALLQRYPDEAVGRVNDENDDEDDGKDDINLEFHARPIEHVAEAGTAAEQFGGKRDDPRYTIGDTQRRYDVGREQRQRDHSKLTQRPVAKAARHFDNFSVELQEPL